MGVIERIEKGEKNVYVCSSYVEDLENNEKTDVMMERDDIDRAELLRLARIGQQMQWVSVKDRLPAIDYSQSPYDRKVDVITSNKRGTLGELRYKSNGYGKTEKSKLPRWEYPNGGNIYHGEVTHWMNLPKPPKEAE